jgi:hypothetical protein
MGVYLNTFRTSHKTATHNGQPIKVYAYRYLCKAGDEDRGFSRSDRRAHLMQASMEHASKLFDDHKPQFAALVYEERWENAIVMSGPKGACHYDSESFGTGVVGFLVKQKRKWVVTTERQSSDHPFALGLPVTRQYTEQIVEGRIVQIAKSYTFSNGVEMNKEQFEDWKAKAEPEYVAKCLQKQAEQTRLNEEAAAARQAKIASKDVEINDTRQRLNQLKQERAAI